MLAFIISFILSVPPEDPPEGVLGVLPLRRSFTAAVTASANILSKLSMFLSVSSSSAPVSISANCVGSFFPDSFSFVSNISCFLANSAFSFSNSALDLFFSSSARCFSSSPARRTASFFSASRRLLKALVVE